VEDLDTDEWWIEADEGILFENSITPIPAQMETGGKVKVTDDCEYGFCNQLGEQIQEYLLKTNTPISEALKQRLGQSKDVKLNKPKMEEEIMTEDKIEVDKTEWKQMQEAIKTASEYIQKDIEAKEKAEKDRLEKEAREEIKKNSRKRSVKNL